MLTHRPPALDHRSNIHSSIAGLLRSKRSCRSWSWRPSCRRDYSGERRTCLTYRVACNPKVTWRRWTNPTSNGGSLHLPGASRRQSCRRQCSDRDSARSTGTVHHRHPRRLRVWACGSSHQALDAPTHRIDTSRPFVPTQDPL